MTDLLSPLRYRFIATFTRKRLDSKQTGYVVTTVYDRYLDESKLVIIDLDQLHESAPPVQTVTPQH